MGREPVEMHFRFRCAGRTRPRLGEAKINLGAEGAPALVWADSMSRGKAWPAHRCGKSRGRVAHDRAPEARREAAGADDLTTT